MHKIKMPKAAKEFKLAKFLWHALIIYFLIYNTYFGWNTKALVEHEKICDMIFSLWFGVVAFIYFRPIFRWFENQAIGFDVMSSQIEQMKEEGCGNPDCEDCNERLAKNKKDEDDNV